MRMNPPRSMGGMGPQVGRGSIKGCVNEHVRTVNVVLHHHQLCSCHTVSVSELTYCLVTRAIRNSYKDKQQVIYCMPILLLKRKCGSARLVT